MFFTYNVINKMNAVPIFESIGTEKNIHQYNEDNVIFLSKTYQRIKCIFLTSTIYRNEITFIFLRFEYVYFSKK